MITSGIPNLLLVFLEVYFFSAFALKIQVKPHGELTGLHKKIIEVVMVQRRINDYEDFLICQFNFAS
jgi:hypothetical protein